VARWLVELLPVRKQASLRCDLSIAWTACQHPCFPLYLLHFLFASLMLLPFQVCLRYFPGAPLALRLVDLHIKDREKVSIFFLVSCGDHHGGGGQARCCINNAAAGKGALSASLCPNLSSTQSAATKDPHSHTDVQGGRGGAHRLWQDDAAHGAAAHV